MLLPIIASKTTRVRLQFDSLWESNKSKSKQSSNRFRAFSTSSFRLAFEVQRTLSDQTRIGQPKSVMSDFGFFGMLEKN